MKLQARSISWSKSGFVVNVELNDGNIYHASKGKPIIGNGTRIKHNLNSGMFTIQYPDTLKTCATGYETDSFYNPIWVEGDKGSKSKGAINERKFRERFSANVVDAFFEAIQIKPVKTLRKAA